MTKRPQKRFDQVKQGDEHSGSAYPDKSARQRGATGHGSQTQQVKVRPAEFVAMSEAQRRAVIDALAELLVEALERHDHSSRE
ncbi:hypothetical protein FHX37_2616 [Haloactinospora alba]|uniref:Uncharacterized protein n=1 Tax=Haloactinospora alba TaxID=405555 RepID=A0A543NLF7_9ACTN|nr:hypothetical protein FHX37_2616 [Haloactinospora alba]